jgi:hypothetical protein
MRHFQDRHIAPVSGAVVLRLVTAGVPGAAGDRRAREVVRATRRGGSVLCP